MKKLTEIHGILGLDYIIFKRVPIKMTTLGEVINLKSGVLELLAARAIVEFRCTIRGLEVKALRKALGFSLEKFAAQLGLSSGAIFKWEKQEKERLHPMNEAVVRSFVAEQLNIKIMGHYSELVANNKTPEEVVLKAS